MRIEKIEKTARTADAKENALLERASEIDEQAKKKKEEEEKNKIISFLNYQMIF